MTGTDFCVNKPHMSRSYLKHLVFLDLSRKRLDIIIITRRSSRKVSVSFTKLIYVLQILVTIPQYKISRQSVQWHADRRDKLMVAFRNCFANAPKTKLITVYDFNSKHVQYSV